MLTIRVVSIFPGFFEGPLGLSIPARATRSTRVTNASLNGTSARQRSPRTSSTSPCGS